MKLLSIASAAICLLAGCGRTEKNVIQQTIAEARTKPQVVVQIRLRENAMPSADELQLRRTIEDAIERQHVGTITRTQSDVGRMDLTVEVPNTVDAIPRIRTILDSAGVLGRSTIRVAAEK